MNTYHKKEKDIQREWHLVDLNDAVLGRSASKIAELLMGKNKTTYSTHMDDGDYVVCINASRVRLTGNKENSKVYRRHSGYPGGFKEVSYKKMIEDHPERVIISAVKGMLPKNRLQAKRLSRLKIFADSKHIYEDKFKNK